MKLKQKNTKKKLKKQSKGITLIALVITIIVLLILAGVTIATLTGDNGLLTQAGDVRNTYIKSTGLEKIKLAVYSSFNNENKIDISILHNNLNELNCLPDNYIFPLSVTLNNYEYGIYDDGSVGNPFCFDLSNAALNTDKYGWKVQNYTNNINETGCWRLFYQDKDYTYIISDNSIGFVVPAQQYSNFSNGKTASSVCKKLNSKINSLFSEDNIKCNIRTTAWLTDTSSDGIWAKYKNNDALFAIGSPSLELFVASYNNGSDNKDIYQIEINSTNTGYSHNVESGWLSVDDNYGIYNNNTSNTSWLLSSPSNQVVSELSISNNGSLTDAWVDRWHYSYRPIVCFKTNIFNETYLLNLVDA